MKEMKKGYRLTSGEEKILRESTAAPAAGTPSRRGWRALLPLAGLFVLMIGLAWGFLHLLGPGRQAPGPETSNVEIVISPAQKALFADSLRLTADEAAAFWPVYTRFCAEIETVRREHAAWLARQRNIPLEEFMGGYTADYTQFNKTVLRYSEAFAAVLDEERVPVVFRLYEEHQGRNLAEKP